MFAKNQAQRTKIRWLVDNFWRVIQKSTYITRLIWIEDLMVGGKKLTAGAKLQIMLFYWININFIQVLYVISVFTFQSTIFISLFSNILEGATTA